MTQVTDAMIEAAQQATRRDGFGIMPHSEVRAALEAALDVLETNNDDLTDDQVAYCHERADNRRAEWRNDLVARLRRKMPALGIVDSGVPNTIMDQASDLIEQQAEEIADNEEFVSILQKEVQRLTAERAEIIEALREMVDTQQSWEDSVSKIVGRPVLPFARAIDRARALLERIGAKEEV